MPEPPAPRPGVPPEAYKLALPRTHQPVHGSPVAPPRPSAPGTAKPPVAPTSRRRARAQGVAPTSPRRRAATEGDLVGELVVGKYAVRSVIGRGGMGTVYDAVHRLTNRRVALKVLLPEHATKPESIARFQQEARVVASIGHSHICEILDFGTLDDGRPFLVMERLEGITLGTMLEQRSRLRPDEVVPVVQQVLLALSAAHAKGVIHRDMKPDNVFLTRRPGEKVVAKVLDFGISKAISEDREVELTRTGMVMGTPYYMAPEQARGDRGLDPRVDVWAVGVILYESLVGRRPFLAKNYNALLVEILTAQHPPMTQFVADVPPGLEAVVDRALRKRRDERYATVQELSAALEPFAGPPARPKLDRFVEIGGVQIPVTWEDTGGETPASGGVKMLDIGALRNALKEEAAATGGAGRPPGHVAASARLAASPAPPAPPAPAPPAGASASPPGASIPSAKVQPPTHSPAQRPAPAPRADGRPPQLVREGSGHAPIAAPRPGALAAPRPEGPAAGGSGRSATAGVVGSGVVGSGVVGSGVVGSGGSTPHAGRLPPLPPPREPAESATEPATQRLGTGKPPVIDDEETTMVLLGSLELSTEEPTPPLRRSQRAGATPPPPPPEDIETTIVDSEPPSFSTDAYRAVKDRRDS